MQQMVHGTEFTWKYGTQSVTGTERGRQADRQTARKIVVTSAIELPFPVDIIMEIK